jgi:hexosaminidase
MTHARPLPQRRRPAALVLAAAAASVAACEPEPSPVIQLLPIPAEVRPQPADTFLISAETPVVVDSADAEAERIAGFLVDWVANRLEERPAILRDEPPQGPHLRLTRDPALDSLGEEGYTLTVDRDSVVIRSAAAAGLYYGVQTLRQLLPPAVEYTAAFPVPLTVPGIRVADTPRYPWRGAMLDVARHFFAPGEGKRFIDLMALHKLNRLHLHLSDDQGWRIEVPGWPNLTTIGGSTEVGGGPGGHYTAEEYADLIRYAAERYVTVVPEIDMPGHINAALASYPGLNCDGRAPELYTGTEVGFSALCTEKEITWTFLQDVIREVSAANPGPWFHVGGDEVPSLPEDVYAEFMRRVAGLVRENGKTMVAWDEVAANLPGSGTVVQLWRPAPWHAPGETPQDTARRRIASEQRSEVVGAQEAGARFILSPASRFYLDMKATPEQVLGLQWAGIPDLRDTYDWDPDTHMAVLRPESILGVEGPLWTETAGTLEDLEYLAFPRLAAIAEFGWSPRERRDWRHFRMRVGAQSARWIALGVNFRRSPLVPWESGPPDP